MDSNFPLALSWVLLSEGGYVDDKEDAGGATNRGITQGTYSAWLRAQGRVAKRVRNISEEEVAEIYRVQYWDGARCGELPSGVDYCTFDLAVNSGVVTAIKFLQRAAGAEPDGHFGVLTRDAVRTKRPQDIIALDCTERLSWLHRLRNWHHFGRGWTSRVKWVREHSMQLA